MEKITVWAVGDWYYSNEVTGSSPRTVDRAMYEWLKVNKACPWGKNWAFDNCDNLEHMWDTLVDSRNLCWLAWVAQKMGLTNRVGGSWDAFQFSQMSSNRLKGLNPWRK